MRKGYHVLAVVLVAMLAIPAFAADIKAPNLHDAPFNSGRVAFTCDDDILANAYFANALNAYGNAFDVGAGGPLSYVEFWHYGWFTLQGPYDYNLKVYDEATCTEIASIPLEAADAFDHDELEMEDLCAYGIAVSGAIVVAVEPLSCAAPTDCYPDVYFEDSAPVNNCTRVVDTTGPIGCDDASWLNDHILRITVDECGGTPTDESSWGGVRICIASLGTRPHMTGARILVLAPVLFVLAACSDTTAPPPPRRVVMVSVDAARADVFHSDAGATNLQALAEDGIVFGRATSPTPQTFPATVSLLTGVYPSAHGVVDEFASPLRDAVPTLGEALQADGWVTAAFPGDPLSHALSGVDRGFGHFAIGSPSWEVDARADSVVAFLDAHPDGNVFVWMGISLTPDIAIWERPLGTAFGDIAAYRDRLVSIDAAIGRLRAAIDASELRGQTLLVVIGTHGEAIPGSPLEMSLKERDILPGHGLDLNEDVLRVPLVIYGPDQLQPVVVDEPWVSTLDVAPTILDLVGVGFDGDGASLGPALMGRRLPNRLLFHETTTSRITGWGPSVAARSDVTKLVRHANTEDAVVVDPGGNPADDHARLRSALGDRYGPGTGGARNAQSILRIHQIWDRALRGEVAPAGAELDSLADANPGNALVLIQQAFFHMVLRNERKAAHIFVDLLDERPDVVEAEAALVEHLLHYGRLEVGIDRLESRDPQAMFELERRWALAALYLVSGELRSAERYFAAAQEVGPPPGAKWKRFLDLAPQIEASLIDINLAPQEFHAHLTLGRALGELEVYKDAYREIQAARGLDPADPEPEYWLGYYLLQEGRPQHARVAFERAVEKDPSHQLALIGLADTQIRLGDPNAARSSLERAVAIGGAPARVHYNYACLLSVAGMTDDALAQLEIAIRKGYQNFDLLRTDSDLDALREDPRFTALLDRQVR